MNRYVVVVLFVVALSTPGSAQEGWNKPEPARSAVPADVPFELVHNPRSADTLRIDKVSGRVWRLQRATGIGAEAWSWKPISPPDNLDALQRSATVNYQLFVTASGNTLLLNVHTGHAWLLRTISGEWGWLAITLDR